MILSTYVNYTINNKKDIYAYKKLGYDVNNLKDTIKVLVSDLPKYSMCLIDVKCDVCDNTKSLSIKQYTANTKNNTRIYTCSQKCSRIKNKETIFNKYGVDNISQSIEIKDKKVKTCLKNHGVEHPQQSNLIFSKSKSTK